MDTRNYIPEKTRPKRAKEVYALRWSRYFPHIAFAFVAIISLLFAHNIYRNAEIKNYQHFRQLVSDARAGLEKRFLLYEQALWGGVGLFDASNTVDRLEWKSYVKALKIEEHLPGVNGLGFIEYVHQDNLERFLELAREDYAPDFINHPETNFEDKFVIKYIEPVRINKEAVGLDIGFEAHRRAAAERARDTGKTALTKVITLVQDKKKTPGFLLLLPVYEKEQSLASREQKKEALKGWVYAPFIGSKFLSDLAEINQGQVGYHVYDGLEENYDNLIFASNGEVAPSHETHADDDHQHSEEEDYEKEYNVLLDHLELGGNTWTIEWFSTDKFQAVADKRVAYVVFAGGLALAITIFLFLQNIIKFQIQSRRNALEEMQRMQQHMAIQGSDLGLWDTNLETGETHYSERWATMLGYQWEDLEQQFSTWEMLVHPDDLDGAKNTFQKHLEGKTKQYEVEHRMRCKDGSWKWILSRGRVFNRDADGKALRAIGTHLDITDRKIIETELRRRTEMLELAEETAKLGHWQFDARTQDVFWSDEVYTIHGVTKENYEPELETALNFYHPDDREEVEAQLLQSISEKKVFEVQSRIVRPDGTVVYVYSRGEPSYDKHGNVEKIFGVFQDISAQIKNQRALEESEKRLETILNNAADGIVSITPTGIVESYNNACEKIFGYTREEILGKNISILTPDEHRKKHDGYLKTYLKTGKSEIIGVGREVQAQRKDGTIITIHLAVSDIEVSGKRLFTGVLRDVSERIAHEKNLMEARESAEFANRTKSEFIANMSHEIRTPMNGIIGTASLLQATRLTKEQKKYAEIITESGDALLKLINDILDISKIEAGKLDISMESFELREAIDQILKLYTVIAKEKNVELQLDYDDNLPAFVKTDFGRLRQILGNLLSNAIKFTPRGLVRLIVEQDQKFIKFSVIDNGIGIAKPKQKDLFKSFSQVHNISNHAEYGGTGLGLSIAKSLVELLEGEIGFESAQGKGSTFWFKLPLMVSKKDDRRKINVKKKERSVKKYKAHILLAEDVETNRLIMCNMLNKLGITYDIAENGKIATELANTNHYDLIFMDLQMPVMDGFEATEVIRHYKADETERMPIIALTAYAMEENRKECLNAGMDDFMTKPIKMEDLMQVLDEWLDSGKAS